MRIVLFASGSPASRVALEHLAMSNHTIRLVVPGTRNPVRRWFRMMRGHSLESVATKHDIATTVWDQSNPRSLLRDLETFDADLFSVATFPYILNKSLLELPRMGAINLHPSLLPRHRGPTPLFWTYLHDDRTTGVTVHWIDEGVDDGDIIAQEEIPLARGRSAIDVYHELSEHGGKLLAKAVADIRSGVASRTPQDPTQATHEPSPDGAQWTIDFERWSAERIRHLLAGLGQMRNDLLRDLRKAPGYLVVNDFQLGPHDEGPGTLRRRGRSWRLHCRDGWIELQIDRRRRTPLQPR